jgi:hypothetical protein
MFAPFVPPYSDDWMRSFEVAIESVCSRKGEGNNTRGFILIPIQSPGGIVDCLQKMLACVDDAKAMEPPIKIITYAVGMVASCAFILYQSGDIAWAADCARFLCHEPTIPRAPAAPGAPQQAAEISNVTKDAASLIALREQIYERAEVCIFRRLERSNLANGQLANGRLVPDAAVDRIVKNKLVALRDQWQQNHRSEIDMFMQHVRLQQGKEPPPYNTSDNILKYITEAIAEDVHNQVIDSDWMLAFDLCDASGIVVEACRQEFLHFRVERTAINERRFTFADRFVKQ